MADPVKSIRAGSLERFQHRLHALAQIQIGVADNRGGGSTRSVKAAGTCRGKTLDEFHFTHGTHLFGSAGSVHGTRLDENGGAYVVAAADVRDQLMEQIALIGQSLDTEVPEMVMRIA